MSGQAISHSEIASASFSGQRNGVYAVLGRENDTHGFGAPRAAQAELPDGGGDTGSGPQATSDAGRARDAYSDGVRACADIAARYDWVSLERSLQKQVASLSALSIRDGACAVFEAKEPASVICCYMFGRKRCPECSLRFSCRIADHFLQPMVAA